MSKWLYIAALLLLVVPSVSAQEEAKDDPKKQTWESEKDRLRYERSEDYKGPDDWSSSDPSDIKEERYLSPDQLSRRLYGSSGSSGRRTSGGRIQYRPQQIQRQRNKRYAGFQRGGGKGTLKYDPKIKRPEPVQAPETPNPDIDMPDSDASLPSASTDFWRMLLIILVIAAAMVVVYLIIRNRKPADKKVVVDVEDEWNPEIITKTELELKLEAAMQDENFRECVRIYFTFILKELIKKGWIRWKREKTNHHYVMEMGGRDGSMQFMECVRIYDLVWYGEYEIDRDIFEMLQPTLLNYYKSLDPTDE